MLASAQTVLHRAVAPVLGAAGFHGEGCRIGRQRATCAGSLAGAASIAEAKAGAVQEADHSK
jgi:hypothetical protein